ncbi:MAG: SAM-dependent chlorinase/fluorinase [Flavobacteriales bacterium]|jgi:S-adenosylmethionine hydrolase|nr:SAM-dependent chlorinase/fluorinase [Flavobacteriales bacterium]MCW8914078.1 SAM-dependent chlorinase/fluorinase [Flavobacteriales bacterium]MCW8938136.1 SAM-dependent chlorinase/fluorinase [Flavobacteriales bacterium]MCW8968245.1 SAM-dependent chlorinase/fluorinase [Flavobacteriales bacterium]MCW8991169.1 SAM-dependent chlorinase/fluorinase [Flavobacteriales bacterium]
MSIITLTTDLGTTDSYAASVKGAILKNYPEATIVDISHEIPAFDLLRTAFLIKTCYADFPPGTIHIIGVESEANIDTPHVVIQYKEQYFIGADNGIFSMIFDTVPEKAIALDFYSDTELITFPTKDVFVKAACHIARGGTMEMLGKPLNKLNAKQMFRALTENDTIVGIAIYIDHYGNIITNIPKQLFLEFGKGRDFQILFREADYNISEISKSYKDVPNGERLALFSSTGFIEIAINNGRATDLFGIEFKDTIRIQFYD